MYCVQNITEDLFFVGASDRRLNLFENVFPIPHGVSYNSYLVMDEQTILLDTVDKAVSGQFFENIEHVLNGRTLDYVIINHMEPDHAATLDELVLRYPQVTIVGNTKTFAMIKQFFTLNDDCPKHVVKEGDVLCTGKHSFTFVMAPMVHWPEVMVTYDTVDKVLFSADAFGTFGALNGNIFADQVNFERDLLDEARRYYANIVGKYGPNTLQIIKKAENLEIDVLCPLHGPIWRAKMPTDTPAHTPDIAWFINKYKKWGSYTAEDTAVVIAYASIYGNTENAAQIVANNLAKKGVRAIAMYDTSVTHPSYIVSEIFRASHIVFASSTYNNGIFDPMHTLLHAIANKNVQNRTISFIENGSWASQAAKKMKAFVEPLKNIDVLEPTVNIKSSAKEENLCELEQLAREIVDSLN